VSDVRQVRLLGLLLVLVGTGGLALTIVGGFGDTEGTAWFVVALAVGIAAVIWKRPRTKEARRRG
jgi:hypothetical protein